jgi:hypothetical protein
VLLSLILMATTVFPRINVTTFALVGAAVMLVGLLVLGAVALRSHRQAVAAGLPHETYTVPKAQWTMPPITLLGRPEWSTGRKLTIISMYGYLAFAVILMVVKAVQLAGG